MKNSSLCPCGSGLEKESCCALYHAGAQAPTALALMRARYAAYVTNNMDYVERTTAAAMHGGFNRLDAERWAAEAEWRGLDILRTIAGGEDDETGQVEFKVRYRHKGQDLTQHELSDFCRENGQWVYSGYEINPKGAPVVHGDKTGRNDPCPCGSGKKYKKCCGG